MRIVINGIPAGTTYGVLTSAILRPYGHAAEIESGDTLSELLVRESHDQPPVTLIVTDGSDSEQASFLPWRVGKKGHTGAAFATKEQALAYLGILLQPPFEEDEELSIWFSLEAV